MKIIIGTKYRWVYLNTEEKTFWIDLHVRRRWYIFYLWIGPDPWEFFKDGKKVPIEIEVGFLKWVWIKGKGIRIA